MGSGAAIAKTGLEDPVFAPQSLERRRNQIRIASPPDAYASLQPGGRWLSLALPTFHSTELGLCRCSLGLLKTRATAGGCT
jgi:hypothetical protein